jgi:hypothetical protein
MKTDTKEAGQKSLDLATRYMANAYKELALAKKNGKYYDDTKHVSGACGVAYKGVLVALDGILGLRGIARDKRKRPSIEYYQSNLGKMDKKMSNSLDTAYKILHLYGYYDGINDAVTIGRGFEEAEFIINKLKQML